MLADSVCRQLGESGLEYGEVKTAFTPRRMIVSVSDVEGTQPDQSKIQRGPAVSASFDSDGQPTKALEGFCKGQAVDPQEVVVEGDYVWVKKTVPGAQTRELLPALFLAAVEEVTFPKTMRWADSNFRFARPIRWILATYDREPVQVKIEHIESSVESRGHRFRSPDTFEARSFDELTTGLRERFVEPLFERRCDMILDQVKSLTGEDQPSNELVEENANLTEWPEALKGQFREEFLELPVPVLKTVMAKHERFFPVPDGNGLTNSFVSVRNGGQEDAVRNGNAWVLNARFNDARFFFEDDKKHTLTDFLDRTVSMTFQDKLGTVRQRCDRLARLANSVALWTGSRQDEAESASQAALFCKADLTTGLVSELDELQGVIGGEYARRDGHTNLVCYAVAHHYQPDHGLHSTTPELKAAVQVHITDQLDKVVGFLGIGFVPTGSSDPYALRKSVTQLIEAVLAWPTPLGGMWTLVQSALEGYRAQGFMLDQDKVSDSLAEILHARYMVMLGARHDVCAAAVLPGEAMFDPRGVRARVDALSQLINDSTFVQTATRPANIVGAARKKGLDVKVGPVREEDLQSDEAVALDRTIRTQSPMAAKCSQAEDVGGVVAALRPLAGPINAFFESTMVMVEDSGVRDARLSMLANCEQLLLTAGDFTKIVIEG